MVLYSYGTVKHCNLSETHDMIVDGASELHTEKLQGSSFLSQGDYLPYGERGVDHSKFDGHLIGNPISDKPVALVMDNMVVVRDAKIPNYAYYYYVTLQGRGYPPYGLLPNFFPVVGCSYGWYVTITVCYRPGWSGMQFNASQVLVKYVQNKAYSTRRPNKRRYWADPFGLRKSNYYSACQFADFPHSWGFDEWLDLLVSDGRISYASSSGRQPSYETDLKTSSIPRHLPVLSREYANFVVNAYSTSMARERREALSDASQSIVNQAYNLSINSIAYAKEGIDAIATIARLLSHGVDTTLLRRALNGDSKALLRIGADGILSNSYGLRLTIADTKEILDHLSDASSYPLRIARSSASLSVPTPIGVLSYESHLKCRYRTSDYGIRGILNDLYRADFAPTATNLWDLVPYSFVVDWITPVGEALEYLDDEAKRSVLPVTQTLRSDKYTFDFSSAWVRNVYNCTGSLRYTTYRRYESSLPPICPHFDGSTKFDSWLEAGALVIQKIMK